MDVPFEVAKIVIDAYEFAGIDVSKISFADMMAGLKFHCGKDGNEAYDLVLKVLTKEVVAKIKAGG